MFKFVKIKTDSIYRSAKAWACALYIAIGLPCSWNSDGIPTRQNLLRKDVVLLPTTRRLNAVARVYLQFRGKTVFVFCIRLAPYMTSLRKF